MLQRLFFFYTKQSQFLFPPTPQKALVCFLEEGVFTWQKDFCSFLSTLTDQFIDRTLSCNKVGYSTTAAVAKLLSLPLFTSVQDQCILCHCLNMQWEGYASQTGTGRYLSSRDLFKVFSTKFFALHSDLYNSLLCTQFSADLGMQIWQ